MPKHKSELNVYAALKATNAELRSSPPGAPKGIQKYLSTLSSGVEEHPYLYLLVSLIIFGFGTGLLLFTYWMVMLNVSNLTSGVYIFLVSQSMTLPLAITIWLAVSDRTVTTKYFAERFVVHFIKTYDDDRARALSSVEKGISSIEIRSGSLKLFMGGILVALLLNVFASSEFQTAFWRLLTELASTDLRWRSVWAAVGDLWGANPLGLALLPLLPIVFLLYAKHFGIAKSWLDSVKLELLKE